MIKTLLKFASVGMICSLLGLTANFILLKYFNTKLYPTYIGVYLTNIFISYMLNTKFTFKVPRHLNDLIFYYGIYISSLAIGTGAIYVFKQYTDFPNWVYPIMAYPITLTWNFYFVSKVLKKRFDKAKT